MIPTRAAAGLAVIGLAAALAGAGARPRGPAWIEVRSPHFTVVSNGGSDAARHVAGQLERMREVFQQAFPHMNVDPSAPIAVLAVQNKKDFQAIEPTAYLGKGKLDLAGYFERTPEGNFILLRLDASDSDDPYQVIYHEYTHLLSEQDSDIMPVWLSEGLAEFYEDTFIEDKQASIGMPEAYNLELLRQSQLLPLTTLFAVDNTSPYYHEEDKGTIFYAEAWALTHYLIVGATKTHPGALANYLGLLRLGADPATAAASAFGNLATLQKQLAEYIHRAAYTYVQVPLSGKIAEKAFTVADVPLAQADAVRAEFQAHVGRYADAAALLQTVLQEDPNNALAHETMGYIAYQQQQWPAAQTWYGQAIQLDPQNYLTQFYFAVIGMRGDPANLDAATAARIEAALQAAIRLNPGFAPAYDRLAVYYAQRRQSLGQAQQLEAKAIQLNPGAFSYRLDEASILLQLDQVADGIAAIRAAQPLASSPAETQAYGDMLLEAEQYQREEQAYAQQRAARQQAVQAAAAATAATPPGTAADDGANNEAAPMPPGTKQVVAGPIQAVRCGINLRQQPFAIEVDVLADGHVVALFADDYMKVPFNAVNFTPQGVLNPCTGMTGMTAKIDAVGNRIVDIYLSK